MPRISTDDRRVWLVITVMVMLSVLFIPFSQMVLGVSFSYTVSTVALGGATLGIVSGVLGCFAVLRRESLMGDALAHAALPGVGIAFLLAGRDLGVLLIGAGIASWIGVQFIRMVLSTTRIKQDAAMGIVLAAWFAAGIALLAYIQAVPEASQAGLDKFIFGQAAAMVESDVQLIAVVGIAAFLVLGLFWKEFKLVTFDPEFAGANGFRVGIINAILSTLIVVAIVLGLQLAGVILMVGMLIAPAIAARQWTQKLNQVIILAAVFGAFAGGTGAVISAVDADVPTGPTIIVVAFSLVMISIAFAPGRGLVWTLIRQRGDKRRFAAQTTLRDLYKYARSHGSPTYPVPTAFILGVGGQNVRVGLEQLVKRGHVRQQDTSWLLTDAGIEVATKDAYSQQLWDLYREYSDELQLPVIAEDRQRDVHEMLPEPVIEKLERKLEGMVAP
jgi:manganese/zinc/iron transport system permease protein